VSFGVIRRNKRHKSLCDDHFTFDQVVQICKDCLSVLDSIQQILLHYTAYERLSPGMPIYCEDFLLYYHVDDAPPPCSRATCCYRIIEIKKNRICFKHNTKSHSADYKASSRVKPDAKEALVDIREHDQQMHSYLVGALISKNQNQFKDAIQSILPHVGDRVEGISASSFSEYLEGVFNCIDAFDVDVTPEHKQWIFNRPYYVKECLLSAEAWMSVSGGRM